MAESPAASKSWLPHNALVEKESLSNAVFEPSSLSFPTEFPYEFDSLGSNSDLNSPGESVASSSESTDSIDEDDFFAGLTQKFAWSSLYDTEKSSISCSNPNNIEKKGVKASSPQSTLSGIDRWYRPRSPSQLQSSSPMTFLGAESDAGAVIHAAVQEAARLKFSGETTRHHTDDPFNRGLIGGRSSGPVKSTNNGDYGLFSKQGCARNVAFAAQVHQVRQDLVLQALYASSWARQAKLGWSAPQHQKQDIRNSGRNVWCESGGRGSPIGLYQSAWLPSQVENRNQQPQHTGSAMRSVHLGGSGVRKTASGTGVFLPRRYVNPSEFRQKPGNPTIQYQGEMKSPIQASFNGCLAPDFDAMLVRRNPLLPLQRSLRAEVAAMNHELHLPQEWTY